MQVLAAAGEDIDECNACGEPGEVALAPENDQPESQLLRPIFVFTPSYSQGQLIPKACKAGTNLCAIVTYADALYYCDQQDS